VEIGVVVQRVNREARVGWAIGWKQKRQADAGHHSRRSCRSTSSNVNGNRATPFSRTEYAVDHRRRARVSGNHELLSRYFGFMLREGAGGTKHEQSQHQQTCSTT